MKKAIFLSFVLVILSTTMSLCVVGFLGLWIACALPYTDIDVETAYNMITNGSYPDLVVLDVRTKSEYESGHIYGATWISNTELDARISELAGHENHEMIVYCRTGVRSVTASEILDSHNFTKVYNMLGGITEWQSTGYSVWIATVHNLNTTFNYDTIQAAIDAPQTLDGHKIVVDAGIYYGCVTIDKSISLVGENKNTTILDGEGVTSIVIVSADNVYIKGFTIRNASGPGTGICIWDFNNNTITGNIIIPGYREFPSEGIWLSGSHNNTISSNILRSSFVGILLTGSTGNVISHNVMTWIFPGDSISLHKSDGNTIYDNIIEDGVDGITLVESSGNTIRTNTITRSYSQGILLGSDCADNFIENNTIMNNQFGIEIRGSGSNTFTDNNITCNAYNFGIDGYHLSDFVQDIDASNTVDGKPIHYWVNQYDKQVPVNAGYVAIVNSTNITVQNLNLTKNIQGVLFVFANNSTIRNVNASRNSVGIKLWRSDHNVITGNEAFHNDEGIFLSDSFHNFVIDNTVVNSSSAIWLDDSNRNSVINNTLLGSYGGIKLASSDDNTVLNNKALLNYYGITVSTGFNNSLINNICSYNYHGISLIIDATYTIIANNEASNNRFAGISLTGSDNNTIVNNEASNNTWSIDLYRASNNIIVRGTITNNTIGVRIEYGSNTNTVYHNNFINNTKQVDISDSFDNVWDDDYPSGGNYWSNYTNADLSSGPYQNETGSDGIGDTPYIIDENNRDRYPLMYPWSPLPIHNINTGLGYATIQEAINSNETLNGHTVFVEEGIYCENLVVNKSLSLNGENRDNTVIDGNFTGTVINIESDNVNITGFTIQNSGYGYGVYVELSDGNKISHNIITNNYGGIALENSSRNNIYGNNIKANNVSGVFLGDSSNNAISGNDITANYDYGIRLDDSSNNTISGNKITSNGSGIWLGYSSIHNRISGNDITANNLDGITLSNSNSNRIFGNNLTANQRDGVGLYFSSSVNSICRNNITNNQYGIELYDSSNHNTISENNIANNYRSIWIFESSFTSVYHNNFVNNTERVATLDSVLDVWDNGYPSGGNYWSDHTDVDLNSGLYQNVTGSDGIWDHPYVVNEDNRDNYPLTEPWTAITTITILSPQNKTYAGASIPLTFTVNRAISWIGYSLNGQENVTISGNTTLTSVPDGSHSIVIYANGASGITGVSSTVYFAVDATAPDIISVTQTPLPNNVLPEDEVNINATVSDNISGVKHATLVYAYTNSSGTWIRTIAMANLEGSVWNATIPAFPYGTNVTYIIIAEDNLGNQKTTEEMGYEYKYQVIPEFPTWTLMLLILIVLTVSIAIDERRPPKTPIH